MDIWVFTCSFMFSKDLYAIGVPVVCRYKTTDETIHPRANIGNIKDSALLPEVIITISSLLDRREDTAIIAEIKKQIGRMIPQTPGRTHRINFKNTKNERLSETISSTYFIDMVTQAVSTITGVTIRNVASSFLNMYRKTTDIAYSSNVIPNRLHRSFLLFQTKR